MNDNIVVPLPPTYDALRFMPSMASSKAGTPTTVTVSSKVAVIVMLAPASA